MFLQSSQLLPAPPLLYSTYNLSSYILWFKELTFSLVLLRFPRQIFLKLCFFSMARLSLPQIFLKIFSSSPLLDGLCDLTDPFYVPSKSIKNRKREVLLHDSLWLINMTASLSFLVVCVIFLLTRIICQL